MYLSNKNSTPKRSNIYLLQSSSSCTVVFLYSLFWDFSFSKTISTRANVTFSHFFSFFAGHSQQPTNKRTFYAVCIFSVSQFSTLLITKINIQRHFLFLCWKKKSFSVNMACLLLFMLLLLLLGGMRRRKLCMSVLCIMYYD